MARTRDWIIRRMEKAEAGQARKLVLRVFQEAVAPTYSASGEATFLGMLTSEFFTAEEEGKLFLVAERRGEVAGVLAVIQGRHIALLFVEPESQGLGIGAGPIRGGADLCRAADPYLPATTVSSSPNSLSFHPSLGFGPLGREKDEEGMRYTPLEKRPPFQD